MRKMFLIGALGMFGALGAFSAAEAGNANVPSYSPYAIMGFDDSPAPAPFFAANPGPQPGMQEHRAAFIEGGGYNATAANTNVPSYSPYAIMPQAQ